MTCVSKSLDKKGFYVGSGMRYIERTEGSLEKFGKPVCGNNIYRVFKSEE